MGWLEYAKLAWIGIGAIGIAGAIFFFMREYFKGQQAIENNKIHIKKELDFTKYVENQEKESKRHEKVVQDIVGRRGPFGNARIRSLLNKRPDKDKAS